MNRRGQLLTSHEVIVQTIATTTTCRGSGEITCQGDAAGLAGDGPQACRVAPGDQQPGPRPGERTGRRRADAGRPPGDECDRASEPHGASLSRTGRIPASRYRLASLTGPGRR